MIHIELARIADVILIMPATAHVIAKLANGLCDDLLSSIVCVATNAPIVVVPAMNNVMWSNSIVQENITKLKKYGIEIWGSVHGKQICGEQGIGSMMEPSKVMQTLIKLLNYG